MECLFTAFALRELLSVAVLRRLCDHAHHLVLVAREAPLAIEWTLFFGLAQPIALIPFSVLLPPVLRLQSQLHHALNFVDSLKDTELKLSARTFIVNSIMAQRHSHSQKQNSSISVQRVLKLIASWKLNAEDFPALRRAQIESFLAWTAFKGHIDDYA